MTTVTTTTPLRIVVSGSGVAGLSFALALTQLCEKNAVPIPQITILERDASSTSRDNEGYSLSLRKWGHGMPGGGVETFEKLGLKQELFARACPGTSFSITTTSLSPLMYVDFSHTPGDTLRITHHSLRSILNEHLPSSVVVQFGSAAVSAEQAGDTVSVKVADGSVHQCDLLVVADGVGSKIRTQIHPEKSPRWMNVRVIAGRSAILPKNLAKGVAMLIGGDNSSLFTASYSETECVWGLMFESESPATDEDKNQNEHELVELARGRGGVYGKYLQSMLDATVPGSVRLLNCYDMYPTPGIGRITFIGDACHPVSPLSASGANLALEDGWMLAEGIAEFLRGKHTAETDGSGGTDDSGETNGDLVPLLRNIEKKAVPRAVTAIAQGRSMLSQTISSGWRYHVSCWQFRAISMLINHPRSVVTGLVCALAVTAGVLWQKWR